MHEASRGFLRSLQTIQSSIIVPTTIVLETANVLIRNRYTHVASVLEYLMTLEIVPFDLAFCQSAFPLLDRVRLKTYDAVVVVTAYIFQTTLISWDKQLLKEATHIVPAMTPSEYLAHRSHF